MSADASPHPGEALRLVELTKRFGSVTAVDRFTVGIPPGQFVGIIGPSGAGKSTLLRLINRLIESDGGGIHYGDTEVTALRGAALRRWRARAAMIFQQFNLIPRLDVLTNVLIGRLEGRSTLPSLLGWFTATERAEALLMLEQFGLLDVALQRAGTLSGGQQQRVAICRAMMQSPALILADEPIASLDPHNARLVMQALRDVHRKQGLTVLANLHHLDEARAYCNRIIAMKQGRLVFDGTPDQLTPERVFDVYGVTEQQLYADGEPPQPG